MNSSHKRPLTKNGGARTSSSVRLGVPVFAADEQALQKRARGLPETLGGVDDSQSVRHPASAINGALEKGALRPRRTFDEVIDTLQLLTVTDVCKLLRISKPTLWRLRRSRDFPDPTTVTERIFGWRRREIDEWLASRPSSRRY
jgi:predicted DNA-binding transcriptional regulator AlpA